MREVRWTPEVIAEVRAQIERGWSVGKLAAHYDLSRPVMAETLRRLGITHPGSRNVRDKHGTMARRPPTALPPPETITEGGGVLLRDVQHCRWPVSGEGEHTRFCDAPRRVGDTYCPRHMRRMKGQD